MVGDPRVVLDPWVPGALDGVADEDVVAVIGSSLTAIDVTGSILNARPGATVIALSRHGDLPRHHEDPWRPRLPQPAFTVEEFLAFDSPFDAAVERIRSFGDDWPRAVDSLRPIAQALWMAMDDDLRRSFLSHYRHPWEIHRHRVAAEIGRDLDRWIAAGQFAVHGADIQRVESERTTPHRRRDRYLDGGQDRGRRRARPRRHGQPAARGRDPGRLVAAGADGDRDRRGSRHRPRARRGR